MPTLPDTLRPALADLLLALADDKLMLGHRNADWTGLAPILEEDIAFSSIAQDEIAHAQALYTFIGELTGRGADDLAFGRRPDEYRCAEIVELADDFDWAVAIARQLCCDHFDVLRLERLSRSSHAPLAALAGRLLAEEWIHVEHVDGWMRRLGRGTDDAHQRMQAALDRLAPIASSLAEPVGDEALLTEAGLYPAGTTDLFDAWSAAVVAVTDAAGLALTVTRPSADTPGGRRGHHQPGFPAILDEMCEVYRIAPGAAW